MIVSPLTLLVSVEGTGRPPNLLTGLATLRCSSKLLIPVASSNPEPACLRESPACSAKKLKKPGVFFATSLIFSREKLSFKPINWLRPFKANLIMLRIVSK